MLNSNGHSLDITFHTLDRYVAHLPTLTFERIQTPKKGFKPLCIYKFNERLNITGGD